MATQLEIYNLALLQMKQSTLADLTEEIEARYVLDALYDFVLKEMVEKGYWVFAMRTVQITQDTAITPAFGYSMAFNMPEDWVKTWASPSPSGWSPCTRTGLRSRASCSPTPGRSISGMSRTM